MKNIINIGIPSKGRLRKDVLKIFIKKKLKLISERGERDLIGSVKNKSNIKILYLHAREIIERLGDNSLDIGFSGFDLLKESEINIQKKINLVKKYEFGKANLVVAIPEIWIDVMTMADLEEICHLHRTKFSKRLRVATKYKNLTNEYFSNCGVVDYRTVESDGSTESAPFNGFAEIITDITSSGETLRANNLRVLDDGLILESSANIFTSNVAEWNTNLENTLNSFIDRIS